MIRAYIALGANLGAPVATITAALAALADIAATTVAARSSLYRTAPVGLKHQPDFINAVAAVDTTLAPLPLLEALFELEARFGRSRSLPNAPRTLDLDLLLHGDARQDTARLILPHPRMHERAFVLAPLAEIAPDCQIPGRGRVAELLARCRDQRVARLEAHAPGVCVS